MASEPRFRPALFRFLADLAVNNDRTWFQENRDRYERDVRGPALAFVAAMGPHLRRLSPHLQADPRPTGGSLFRIHRDVRFSRDKSPYKTHVGIQFRHDAGRDAHAPGLYLHLEPRGSFVAAGVWRPDTASARRIRAAIASEPDAWRVSGAALAGDGWESQGERLARAPRGFRPDHPLIDDLKRKSWIELRSLTQREVTRAGFPERLGERLLPARSRLGFLCRALGLPF
ncbi:MAG: TIGR02453 family protein [Candidatus Krumholzibacteriia bacterium]